MVNLFDIPEMMPGAQARANPSQRGRFERRCLELYQEDCEDGAPRPTEKAVGNDLVADLEGMFPMLDLLLIQDILADSSTERQAIDTLLALSGADLQVSSQVALPRDPVDDNEVFPALIGTDGWEVPGIRALDLHADQQTAWRDRAISAAELPQPQKPRPRVAVPLRALRTADRGEHVVDIDFETEQDYRRRKGRHRAENRAKYGRKPPNGSVDVVERPNPEFVEADICINSV